MPDAQPLLTRAEWVGQRLRAAILSNELKPGERIRPADLALRWNVSPTPLREALLRLAADGLVETTPHRGTRVAKVSAEALMQLYEMRLLLEPLALRKALEHRDEIDQRRVREAYDVLVSVHGIGDPMRGEEAHRDFHRSLFEACESPWLLSFTDTMSQHSTRYRLLSLDPRGGWEAVHHEHAALFAAFLAGETDTAVELLTGHIRRTLDIVLALPKPPS